MLQHTVHALQSELDTLRADNIKLYEKIKFLQSYPGRVSVHLSVCLSLLGLGSHNRQPPDAEIAHFQCAACMGLELIGVGKALPARKAVWSCAEGSLTSSKPEAQISSLAELP